MEKNITKLTILILSTCILLASLLIPTKTYAYIEGSVLGTSVIVPTEQLYIDGTKVIKPDTIVSARSNRPSIFGYTLSNVTVHLTIQDNPGKRVTTTDSNGYWIYNVVDKPISRGTHKLYLSITDNTGASSGAKLAATFNVPAVLGASAISGITPLPVFNKLNYFTISLSVFAAVFLLILMYLLAKRYRKPTREWKVL